MRKVLVFAIMASTLLSCNKECDECNENEDTLVMQTLRYPDGMVGEPLLIMEDTLYTVPEGKTLYIHYCEYLFEESGTRQYFFQTVMDNDYTQGEVVIVPSGTTLNNQGILNGLLIDSGVEVFAWNSEGEYVVPAGLTLYMTSFKAEYLLINGEFLLIHSKESRNEIFAPFVLPAGTTMEHRQNYIFTGYFR